MGHSREDKARSRERIVEVAAARIRESGTVEPGVAEIMKAAGLTHGGFYKHFGSRDELVAEAVATALAASDARAIEWTDGADDPLAAFVDHYLAAGHRDAPADGCAVACLVGDVARGGAQLQDVYGMQVARYVAGLEHMIGRGVEGDHAAAEGGAEVLHRQALVAVSALVGSLVLSRAVADPKLSDELLEAVREAVGNRALGV